MMRFLWKAGHGSRVRVPLLLAVGAGLLAAPSAGAGGQAGFGCAPGFELGANTAAQALVLPRIQAGTPSSASASASRGGPTQEGTGASGRGSTPGMGGPGHGDRPCGAGAGA